MADSKLLMFAACCLLFGCLVKEPPPPKVYPSPEATIVVVEHEDFSDVEKHCLAVMVYGEAEGESFQGKLGVAYVALNRYNTGKYEDICQVVLKTQQFKAVKKERFHEAIINKSTPRLANIRAWEESKEVANLVYDVKIPDPTKGALYFLNPHKLRAFPKWAYKLKKTAVIGRHYFYA